MNQIAVGYARASSREKDKSSIVLAGQRARIEATSVSLIFQDLQLDGDDNQPEFLRLMELVRAGRVDQLYITELDRLTRSLKTLEGLMKEFKEHGVILIVLDQEKIKVEHKE